MVKIRASKLFFAEAPLNLHQGIGTSSSSSAILNLRGVSTKLNYIVVHHAKLQRTYN